MVATEFRASADVLGTVADLAPEIQAALTADPEQIDVYVFLQARFRDTEDLRTDSVFKSLFRSYYRLDYAGLSEEFKKEFFEVFEECRLARNPDIPHIVKRLIEVKTLQHSKTLQFSFASKMAATINPQLPIYDSLVAALFSFSTGYHTRVPDLRIQRFMRFYDHLRTTLTAARDHPIIATLSDDIGKKVSAWNGIEWAKKADFVFWSAGKVMKKRHPKRFVGL